MGPSRKRARTKPPSQDEPSSSQPAGDNSTTTTKPPSTPLADNSKYASTAEEDASTPLKNMNLEGDSTKDVSLFCWAVSLTQ